MRKLLPLLPLGLVALVLAGPAFGQGVPIKSGDSSDLAKVDGQKNVRTSIGQSTRPTYIVSATGNTCTAAVTLSIEAGASTGFKLARVCVYGGQATASTNPVVTVARRSTASSGGTACTAEGTSAGCAISKMDPADGNWPGVARVNGTPGTAGAILDAWGVYVGELGTGESGAQDPFCKEYGTNGGKLPVVASGTANGLSVVLGSPGAGGTGCTIAAHLIAE